MRGLSSIHGRDGPLAESPVARPKNLSEPGEVIRFPGYTEYIVEIGDLTVARVIQEPGWVYSRDMATVDEGRWCETHHVGVTISGDRGWCYATDRDWSSVPTTCTTSRQDTTATPSVRSRR